MHSDIGRSNSAVVVDGVVVIVVCCCLQETTNGSSPASVFDLMSRLVVADLVPSEHGRCKLQLLDATTGYVALLLVLSFLRR